MTRPPVVHAAFVKNDRLKNTEPGNPL